jgi:MoaA/NifB/PqqE/SkfB family radical SAM enzyme
MELRMGDKVLYTSTFDPKRGTLVRMVETPHNPWGSLWGSDEALKEKFPGRSSSEAFSPVPETVDVAITDRCAFGCTYCYMDSRPRRKHAPTDLVERVITGFDQPPYQMAIGGGEPTEHPDFTSILRRVRELGTVPNYTTNGDKMTSEIAAVTNEVCGGVAMTYHAFKGIEWFKEHYGKLREALRVQVNVHVIADKNVANNLSELNRAGLGKLRVVLLAYYPDVGRASLDNLITKRVYMRDMPEAIKTFLAAGHDIAFSEGLLPYFLSRPELGVNTKFAMRSEGLFSCFIDTKGRMSTSSFSPPRDDQKWYEGRTVFDKRSQELWNTLGTWGNKPSGSACLSCKHQKRCATPHEMHYLMCAFEPHNNRPLKDRPGDIVPRHLRILDDKDIV